jgi:predicted RNase H-like HicB family nuclease
LPLQSKFLSLFQGPRRYGVKVEFRTSFFKDSSKIKNKGGWPMATEYTAVIKPEGDWWIGWIEEIPGVNCQERSRQELVESLRVTLQEAIEFNRQDAIASAGTGYYEEKIAVPA